jgi:hypothetical protein
MQSAQRGASVYCKQADPPKGHHSHARPPLLSLTQPPTPSATPIAARWSAMKNESSPPRCALSGWGSMAAPLMSSRPRRVITIVEPSSSPAIDSLLPACGAGGGVAAAPLLLLGVAAGMGLGGCAGVAGPAAAAAGGLLAGPAAWLLVAASLLLLLLEEGVAGDGAAAAAAGVPLAAAGALAAGLLLGAGGVVPDGCA